MLGIGYSAERFEHAHRRRALKSVKRNYKRREVTPLGKHKKLKEKVRYLENRVFTLEKLSKANSCAFGVGLTYPQFVKRMEEKISRLDACDKKGD